MRKIIRAMVAVTLVLSCCSSNIVFAVDANESVFLEPLNGEVVAYAEKIAITENTSIRLVDAGNELAAEEEIINLADMEYVVLDDTRIVIDDDMSHLRATTSVSWTVDSNTLKRAKEIFPMEAGECVTINCSYTPRWAGVDFGLVAPDNRFYYFSGKEGSINRAIKIDERGEYRFAVYNNSSNTVNVTGFIEY